MGAINLFRGTGELLEKSMWKRVHPEVKAAGAALIHSLPNPTYERFVCTSLVLLSVHEHGYKQKRFFPEPYEMHCINHVFIDKHSHKLSLGIWFFFSLTRPQCR